MHFLTIYVHLVQITLIAPTAFAVLLTRILVGFLFMRQGYDKIFTIGRKEVLASIQPSFKSIGLSNTFTQMILFLTSWIEFLAGFFLLIGLFKYYCIYLLGIDLMIVVVGMSLIQPVLDLKLIFPRLILLLLLLLLPAEADVFCLDRLLF